MYGFTEELFEDANANFAKRRPSPFLLELLPNYPPRFGEKSDVSAVVSEVEEYFGHKLPEDVIWLASNIRDIDGHILRWTKGVSEIKAFENWVFQGIEFDVRNGKWPKAWGEMPDAMENRLSRLNELSASWPKLIPLTNHRALPVDPPETNNPVFSIMQTDIIYYGCSLSDWFKLDHAGTRSDYVSHHTGEPIRRIPAWSDFAEQRWNEWVRD